MLNLSYTASAREDSEFRNRTGLEPPKLASESVLDGFGNPLRTFPDELYEETVANEESDARSDQGIPLKFVNVQPRKADP